MPNVSVVVADSTTESREQITSMLESETSVNVVADARDGREAVELAKSLEPDVLVADINLSGVDVLSVVEQVRSLPSCTAVIVVSPVSDFEVVRNLMQAGASDCLPKPLNKDDLIQSVMRTYERVQKERMVRSGNTEGPTTGRIITVYSPQGGSGKSVMAGNLGVAIAAVSGSCALVDLNLHFGDIDLMLNLTPDNTIAGLAQKYNELDPELLETFMCEHDSGLRVLSAPSSPQYAETITVYVVEQVLEIMKQTYDFIVIDTPSGMQDTTLAALDATDTILLLTTLDLLALHNTKTALDMLTQMYPPDKIRLILNRANADVGITPEDVESTLGMEIACHIPSDGRVVVTSVNEGVPFMLSQPDAEISRRLTVLAYQLMDREPPAMDDEMAQIATAAGKKKGFLAGLLGAG